MIYSYECTVCGKVQDKWHKLKETNTEACSNEACKAPPDQLRRLLTAVRPHVSWSSWKV